MVKSALFTLIVRPWKWEFSSISHGKIDMKVPVHFKNDAAFLTARDDDSALFYRPRLLKSYLIKTIEKEKQD